MLRHQHRARSCPRARAAPSRRRSSPARPRPSASPSSPAGTTRRRAVVGIPGPTAQGGPNGWIDTMPPPFSVDVRFTDNSRGPRNSALTSPVLDISTVHGPVPSTRRPSPRRSSRARPCAVSVTVVPGWNGRRRRRR
jgi:hypothetical protein